jgi:putative endonuclease
LEWQWCGGWRYYVYIMASKSRVLYIGVTGFLMARVLRHKAGEGGAFTSKYRVHRLVYFHSFQNVGDASRGKRKSRVGGGKRKWR